MENKESILKEVDECVEREKQNKARNSMGVSESNYNPYYLISQCFDKFELEAMTEAEIKSVYKIAEHATEVFY